MSVHQGSNRRIKLAGWLVPSCVLLGALLVYSQLIPGQAPTTAATGASGAPRAGFVRHPPVFETVPPQLPNDLNNMAVLIFSKTQAYRDDDAQKQAIQSLTSIAQQNGWTSFATENGAVFNADMLKHFKVVVWNNTSGDPLNEQQEDALKTWVENGGGWVGIHNAGGDRNYTWKWYGDTLFGAGFNGHASIRWGTIHVEDKNHPSTRGLPESWSRIDEWYSFTSNPRAKGYHILLTADENSYNPPDNVKMGADHPLAWWHCVGKGRSFYTALGHRGTSYLEPTFRQHIAGAISWASGIESLAQGCSEDLPVPAATPAPAPAR